MMWTLVLIVMLVNTSAGGGANSTVTLLDFATEPACTAAAKGLSDEGSIKKVEEVTAYRIVGKCVQRQSTRGFR